MIGKVGSGKRVCSRLLYGELDAIDGAGRKCHYNMIYQTCYYPAIAQVRHCIPGFQPLTDRTVYNNPEFVLPCPLGTEKQAGYRTEGVVSWFGIS